jgi:hypothetical protein
MDIHAPEGKPYAKADAFGSAEDLPDEGRLKPDRPLVA